MTKNDKKILYISKDLHKRIKMYCLAHELKSMSDWADPILEEAIRKPSAKERLERQAAITPLEAVEAIDEEEAKSTLPQKMEEGTVELNMEISKEVNNEKMINILD